MYRISLFKQNENYFPNDQNAEYKEFTKLTLNFVPQIGTALTIKKGETYKVKDIEYNLPTHCHFLKVEKL